MLSHSDVVKDVAAGYKYRAVVEDGAIYQVEERDDDPTHTFKRKSEYLVGSGTHAQTSVAVENGLLTMMPLAWYRDRDAWGFNPGYETNNRRFSRPVLPGCIACHATAAKHVPPTRNRFQLPIEDGIHCARCHGDNEKHAEYWRSSDRSEEPAAAKMIDPGDFDASARNDLCMQCHLQGDVVLYKPGRDPLTYQPGDRLRDHRHDLLAIAPEPTQLGVGSHGARMLQSRCYIASDGKLTCVLCHDPHKPVSDFSHDYFDDKCASCHQPDDCRRQSNPPSSTRSPASASTSCVGCHMPKRDSREGVHLVFTDHAIVKSPPVKGAAQAKPANLKPNAQVSLASCWPGDIPPPAILGAAYVHFHDTMSPQMPSVDRAVGLLEEAVKLAPADSESRYWLGSAYLAKSNGKSAVEQFKEVLRLEPERHAARFRLGLALELNNEFDQAVFHYEHLVRAAPYWVEPYPRLTQLYLFRRDATSATRAAQQQLAYQEDGLAYAQLALAHRLNGGGQVEALQYLKKSIALDPLLPTAYLNRGVIDLLSGDNDAALADFQRVLRLEPTNEKAQQAVDALRKRGSKQ